MHVKKEKQKKGKGRVDRRRILIKRMNTNHGIGIRGNTMASLLS